MAFNKKKYVDKKRAELDRNPSVAYYDWQKGDNPVGDADSLKYRFLIVRQDPRDINTAYSTLVEHFKPFMEERRLMDGNYGKYCFLFLEFESLTTHDNLTIGRLRRDRRIWDKGIPGGLESHVHSLLESLPQPKANSKTAK